MRHGMPNRTSRHDVHDPCARHGTTVPSVTARRTVSSWRTRCGRHVFPSLSRTAAVCRQPVASLRGGRHFTAAA